MKELSIEEKAKAYDEAMKQAIEIYDASNEDGKLALEMIFPELAESEDERIRQEMIDFLQETIDNVGESPNIWTMANAKKWLAWLEKQGEQKCVDTAIKAEIERRINCFKAEKDKDGACEVDNLSLGGRIAALEELLSFINTLPQQKPTDKVEPKFKVGDKIWHKIYKGECIYHIIRIENDNYISDDNTSIYISTADREFELVENQGEQKPTDKVEPKFKVGDWVVNKFGDVWHIDSFDKKNYQVSNGNKYNYFPISKQDEMHLWTIQDAKDGDVLAVTMYPEGTWIGILKEHNGCTFSSYCFVNTEGTFKLGTYNHGNGKAIHPATKEQRDLLFQKMKDAGYEWDAEKKELKKIEQKPVEWSEEDEKIKNNMTQEDKELLLKDLCTRLPYGVIIHLIEPNEDEELYCLNISQEGLYTRSLEHNNVTTLSPIEDIKPYLRPMSSMTEEEIKELLNIDIKRGIFSSRHLTWYLDGEVVDFLNSHHFDYRGLIEKGLALEAPENMYK